MHRLARAYGTRPSTLWLGSDAVALTIDAWCYEQASADIAALRAASREGMLPLPVPVEVM